MSNVGTVGRKWLRERAAKSKIVMSVCMGAFLLADAGLLDGKQVTTHRWAQAQLQTRIPSCTVVSDRRFVDSGHVVSTGGVTAGIDGALHVVERLAGRKTAQWTAEEWMEYRGYKPRQRSTSILTNP
jgi:transcriptional regulator GlxA family with amidase domain